MQYSNGAHFCGATLINSTRAITAAHCVIQSRVIKPNEVRNLKILLKKNFVYKHFLSPQIQLMGDDLTIRSPGSPTRQILKVKKIVAHPKYNPNTLQNDIAVLIVSFYYQNMLIFN